MEAYSDTALGWSPMPGRDWAGGDISRANQIHETAARPVGHQIEPFAVAVRTFLAVGGQGCVDHSLVERAQIFEIELQGAPHRQRLIGDIDVTVRHQLVQDGHTFGTLQIETQAAFVARIHLPHVVRVCIRGCRQCGQHPIGIADTRHLHLDHIGTEIRKDRGGHRSGDPGTDVEHLESREEIVLVLHSAMLLSVGDEFSSPGWSRSSQSS